MNKGGVCVKRKVREADLSSKMCFLQRADKSVKQRRDCGKNVCMSLVH